jgi:hypothetical protein
MINYHTKSTSEVMNAVVNLAFGIQKTEDYKHVDLWMLELINDHIFSVLKTMPPWLNTAR